MKEAMFYSSPLEDGKVQCFFCNHRCTIPHTKRGWCGVRENLEGKLYSLVYGRAISLNVDPIEKKPLFHLFPGSTSFTFCPHCGKKSVERIGFRVIKNDVVKGACPYCKGKIDGIWN